MGSTVDSIRFQIEKNVLTWASLSSYHSYIASIWKVQNKKNKLCFNIVVKYNISTLGRQYFLFSAATRGHLASMKIKFQSQIRLSVV
jgi:hypothetical protein